MFKSFFLPILNLFCAFSLAAIIGASIGVSVRFLSRHPSPLTPKTPPNTERLYAVLVSTNLVSQPCTCGVCDPSRGIAVPEHIGQIGYDLSLYISTNYLPIVSRPL